MGGGEPAGPGRNSPSGVHHHCLATRLEEPDGAAQKVPLWKVTLDPGHLLGKERSFPERRVSQVRGSAQWRNTATDTTAMQSFLDIPDFCLVCDSPLFWRLFSHQRHHLLCVPFHTSHIDNVWREMRMNNTHTHTHNHMQR